MNVSEWPGFSRYRAIVPNIKPSPPASMLVRAGVEQHLDKRALLDHPVDVVAPPRPRDVRQDLAALRLAVNDPRLRGQVRMHLSLEVERERGAGRQVGQ